MIKAIHQSLAGKLAWGLALIYALGLVVAFCVDASAQTGNSSSPAATHCAAGEKVVFSCPFKNGKTVSLCASSDLSKDSGTLQYRFGRVGRTPELKYPAVLVHPSNSFWYSEADEIYPAKATYVGFDIGAIAYQLTVSEASNTDEYFGILRVSRREKLSAEMRCPLSTAVNFVDLLSNIGIPDLIQFRKML